MESGERWQSSPRTSRAARCGRGRVGDGESESAVGGVRGGRRWRRRLPRASGVLWLDGELQGEGAELLRVSERRGGGCGYVGDERRRRAPLDGAREGESRRGRDTGEWERVEGPRGVSRGIQTKRGEGRQAGRLVAWRGGARARRARAHPPVEDEDDRGGGQWAGPALAAAGQTRDVTRALPLGRAEIGRASCRERV